MGVGARRSIDRASLYLDPQIRDWVLFPITVVMILVGVLRHYVMVLLQSTPKKLSRAALREQRALARSQILRATSAKSPIPPLYYKTISHSLSEAFKAGAYLKDGPPKGDSTLSASNPFSDPAAMDGMMAGMKTQMVMMVPQMVIMGWINFFFQGFVLNFLVKLPFPLTLGFKSMLQRGIETPDMDVRWVSSLSWYFLNFFGLNGLYRLILGGDNSADSTRDMTVSPFATMGTAQAGQPQDYAKLFKAERDNLEFSEGLYTWAGEDIDTKILGKYGKLAPSRE
ncbi:transmembrane protein [Boletus edulis]|nr:transmembrane protein [Boletus edulis]